MKNFRLANTPFLVKKSFVLIFLNLKVGSINTG